MRLTLRVLLHQRDERSRVVPLAEFRTEDLGLIDDDKAVGIDEHAVPLERPGRRALEVHARDVIPRAVTRALELALTREPVGDATQVRADGRERDQPVFARR